ncbi:cbb3-type cytochrome c oxidase subunit 3 [Robiginitomaculum antarcticum]|uniref:cbb3-type cytochrome c oxidase subunit 3 n=1 Tax=Robiginitomaculum antarcticum TaxID=437507 RepID=UPI000360844E|nr:cbb3-type cytochrome c oxidase subunit 3 [Robiginitomaculum antarcticum]
MSYDILAHFIKIGGTVFFTGFFVLAIVYALWPKNKKRFDSAAQIPLCDDDRPELGDGDV